MIITCPACTTRYTLAPEKVKPGGQKVRCAKCGTVWHQVAEEEPLAPAAGQVIEQVAAPGDVSMPSEAPAAPEPQAAAAPAEAAAPPAATGPLPPPGGFAPLRPSAADEGAPSGAGRRIALAVIVLVALAVGGVLAFRQQIQDMTGIPLVAQAKTEAAAPAPAPAPAKPVPPPPPQPMNLTLDEVESSIEEVDGIRKLIVKGIVSNPEAREQKVPDLAFDMLDKDGRGIGRWTFDPPVRALGPKMTARFTAQRDPPAGGLRELKPGFDVPENVPPPPAETPLAAPGATGTAPQPAAAPPR